MRFTITLFVFILSIIAAEAQKAKEMLYVGTFFGNGSQGIYVFQFDRQNGKLSPVQIVPTLESPTFLTVHPTGKFLYSVNRGSVEEMKNSGSVSAFSIDQNTGKLTPLNNRPSYGNGPCHIAVDKTGKWAVVSNYSEGNFVVLPIFDDGILGSGTDSRKHIGQSVNPSRQTKSYVHSAVIASDNRYVIVSDLGTDKIYSYRLDAAKGRISENSELSVSPGCGPRHFAFHPNGKFAYSAEELTSTVAVMSFDAPTGNLTLLQDSVVSLPASFTDKNTSADIHVHPNGKYVYMSNRGHDALAIFSIDTNGLVTLAGHQNTMGKTPRNFLIDAKGQYLLAANQASDNIVVFRVDASTGKLTYTGNQVKVPSPVCLELLTLR